jgi:hypothetical protein
MLAGYARLLAQSQWKISPWMEPTFWKNMRSPHYSTIIAHELIRSLASELRRSESSSPLISSILISICHIHCIYNLPFEPASVQKEFDEACSAKSSEVMSVVAVLAGAEAGTLLDRVLQKQADFLSFVLPHFSFLALLKYVRVSDSNFLSFFQLAVTRLSHKLRDSEAQTLIFVLSQFTLFFPPLPAELVNDYRRAFIKFLARTEPTASLACDFALVLDQQLRFPGYAFWRSLIWAIQFNEISGGVCQVLFDIADTPFLPNFLYSTTLDQTSIKSSFLTYVDFFLHSYFETNKEFSLSELTKFATTFVIDEGYLRQFGLENGLQVRTPPLLTSSMTLPLFKLQPVKLPQLEQRMELRPGSRAAVPLFMSGRHIIIKKLIFDPIRTAVDSEGISSLLLEYRFVVIGSDLLLSNVFTSLYANATDDSVLLHSVLTIYYVPSGQSQIADFIASFDPIYARWVRGIYGLASKLAPTFDVENGAIQIPALETPATQEWEANLWFSDRSPSHLLQLSIQTFLYGARSFVEICVWQCVLKLAEGKVVAVPFLISVRIPIEVKKTLDVEMIDAGRASGKKSFDKGALAFWNTNGDLRVKPTDGWFLLESEKDAVMLFAVKVSDSKGGQFAVTIDGRAYGNVEGMSIMLLPDETQNGEQWRLRLATFVPFK